MQFIHILAWWQEEIRKQGYQQDSAIDATSKRTAKQTKRGRNWINYIEKKKDVIGINQVKL